MKGEKSIKYGLFSSILIALGPIMWLLINLYNKNYEDITLNVILVIVSISLVLFNLRNYLRVYTKKNNVKLDILMHMVSFIFYILLIIVLVIAFIAMLAGITFVQRIIFIKEDYLTYLIKYPYSYLVFLILMLVGIKIKKLYSEKKIVHLFGVKVI